MTHLHNTHRTIDNCTLSRLAIRSGIHNPSFIPYNQEGFLWHLIPQKVASKIKMTLTDIQSVLNLY